MGLKTFEVNGYKMKNYMENVVLYTLNMMEANFDGCKCDKCLLDIAAIVLNKLPPKYNTSFESEAVYKLQMLQQQFEVDAMTAIIAAQKTVSENPRHSKEELEDTLLNNKNAKG